ncbi:hypothetical protein KC333_g6306 [Hortaea werneckii]|nr:hypothetical protein KC333_g6306 [Hortaea werneckii]KAI7306269.1 hypothetical protein KC326_g7902 [Hortaea werneckii]
MSSYVAVFFIDDDGTTKIITPQLDKEKLLHFSGLATKQLATGGSHNKRINKHALTLPPRSVESTAAARITTWIADNSLTTPVQMTLENTKITTFEQLVYTLAASNAFQIPRYLRGDGLRDALYEYLHQSAVSLSEFAMLVEILPWDLSIINTAVHCVMYGASRGPGFQPPEYELIVAYAKRVGMWEDRKGQRGMRSIGHAIGAKMRGRQVGGTAAAAGLGAV